nr:hypothetical protein [Lachnospiraceae bacterium]
KQNLQRQVGTLYAATNVTSRLGEIALPKDWEWVYPETELKIDPDGNIKTYEARCSKESYLPFTVFLPVGVTEVTGAYITGDDELTVKHTGSYQLHLRLDGYNVPLEKNKTFEDYLKSIVSCSWQGDSLLTVNNKNGWETTATAGVVELSAEAAVRATVVVGDETFREDFNVVILADHITELAIIPKESVKNRLKFTFDENEKAAYVYDKDLAGNADTIILTATARMENRNYPVSRGTLSWKVNDENLATIIEQDDGTAVLRVLGSGTIIVTATAEDAGRKEATLAVEVRDYAPLFDMKNVLINIYSTEGVELPVYAVEGNPITRISIGDTNFRVEKNNERFYLMIVNKSAYVSKTVIDTTMNIRTRMSIDVDIPIRITVDTSKPKITFKAKTAPNVFFTDTTAVYTVNSSYDIIDITNDIDKDSVITKGFEVTSYNSTTKQLTIRAKGLTADNVHEFLDKKLELNNVKVLVRYKNYGTISETIKLSLQNKKPSYKIREISTVNARPSYQTYLYNNSDKTEIALSTNAVITSITDRVTAEMADTGRILVKYDDVKSKSYKLSIQDKNWTSPIALTGKISIVKSLATVLGSKSVTLNMAHNMTANGIVTIPVEAKNNLTPLSKVDLIGANKKSADLLSSGYLDIRFIAQKQQLEVGLKETRPASIKVGTYTIAVTGYLPQGSSGEVALTKANLKVVLVSKVPAVKFTAKSSINLIDRENTAIIYTPKISNMTTSITRVTTSGANSGFFRARLLSDGKIQVKAVPNVQLRKGTSYTLGLRMEFDNNTEVTTNVKIKPTNKLPSIKASATKATIYKVSANPIRYEVYNAGTFGSIESITLVESKASANFNFSVSKDNVVTVSLKPEVKRTIKNGKYTISYQVKMKDAAINSNPKTLKMTITVK